MKTVQQLYSELGVLVGEGHGDKPVACMHSASGIQYPINSSFRAARVHSQDEQLLDEAMNVGDVVVLVSI